MVYGFLANDGVWWSFCLFILLSFFVVVKLGALLGHRIRRRAPQNQKEQVTTGVQAMLALTGFLLAVSFTIADGRYSERKRLVLEEANAIGTTYLRTQFLPEQASVKSKNLLRKYVRIRLQVIRKNVDIKKLLKASERIQNELWKVAVKSGKQNQESTMLNLYVDSLNNLIDLHSKRVTYGLVFHISRGLMMVLFLSTYLTLAVLGVNFGLKGAKLIYPSSGPILLFAVILLMIMDLDQPKQRFFGVSQQPLEEVLRTMN